MHKSFSIKTISYKNLNKYFKKFIYSLLFFMINLRIWNIKFFVTKRSDFRVTHDGQKKV